MEIWKLKDDLHKFARNLCDDLADDIVQETFLYSIENDITDRGKVFSACQQIANKFKKITRKDPGAALNKYVGGADEGTAENLWRRLHEKTEGDKYQTWEDLVILLRPLATFKGKWLPFDIAKSFIQGMNFERCRDFQSFISANRHVPIPRSANAVYANQWAGWDDFLGYKFYSFPEFCMYLRTVLMQNGVTSPSGFRTVRHPKHIPKAPDVFYGHQWRGWPHAFGRELTRNTTYFKKKRFLPYAKARAFVRRHLVPKGIDTLKRWDQRINEIPMFLPSSPDTYYKGKGWINSCKFFGTKKLKIGEFKATLSYEEARLWVIKYMVPLGINNSRKWEEWRQGKYKFPRGTQLPPLPKNFPLYPSQVYKGRGWRSMRHWFGSTRVYFWEKAVGEPWSYLKCKQWVKKNLKGQVRDSTEWKKYIKGEMPGLPELPGNLWRNPWHHFKTLGQWKGWSHFLSVRKWRIKR